MKDRSPSAFAKWSDPDPWWFTQYWAVRIPVALVGASVLDLGVAAVFWGVTLSNVAAALWLAGYFRVSTDRGMLARAAEDAAASD